MPDFTSKVDSLRVYERGDRRAPHKPLLLLLALGRLQRGTPRLTPCVEVCRLLLPLLEAYAPPVKSRHLPELPYWHLQSDGLWEVTNAERLPLQRGGFPRMAALRETSGGLDAKWVESLQQDPRRIGELARRLLSRHFPESLHRGLLQAVGLDLATPSDSPDPHNVLARERPLRDPEFRRTVLRAYEHRCAVTGFRAALGGSYFGVEAAHVRWHSAAGPDEVSNGLVLNPLLHLLFDRGA